MDRAVINKAAPTLSRLLRRRAAFKRLRQRGMVVSPEEEVATFFSRWLKAPHRIGAVAPSSRYLARAMATQVDLRRAEPVVELGGGTGSVTRALLEACLPAYRLVVVESDERLYKMLRPRFPQLRIIRGDALQLVELLRPLRL